MQDDIRKQLPYWMRRHQWKLYVCLLYTSYRLGGGRKIDLHSKPSPNDKLTSPENLFKFQSEVMRELAESEPCIFVGRAAGYVLDQDEDIERLIRIFVYADKVKKVQRVMEVDCIDEERAKRRIKKIEKERKEYYKYFTGSEWHSMKNYDLPINTTKLTLEETAELIKAYIRLKGFMAVSYTHLDVYKRQVCFISVLWIF